MKIYTKFLTVNTVRIIVRNKMNYFACVFNATVCEYFENIDLVIRHYMLSHCSLNYVANFTQMCLSPTCANSIVDVTHITDYHVVEII